ncbi:GNAT family N-acetyltransferase [Mesorhizobium sp. B2-1-3A]|uniref:GNAT family N-acetyltransferase n=1 Tax=Mesorhizobium sp. B2-1-3A TaxID=2589971 RepID=UPI001FEDE126|nr:GNAT family N-acetyltransferase [Mesorhizobium sp. B2-1-3A]
MPTQEENACHLDSRDLQSLWPTVEMQEHSPPQRSIDTTSRKPGSTDRAVIGAELCDDSGEVRGGLWGRTELGLLFLDMFFLPEPLRGRSFGSQILKVVEEEAVRRGCKKAVVETSSFQAPLFYVRHGFEEFGKVEFAIPGHARIFLRKDLR